ncbi:MAG: NAD-dependent epimerase/dehydratase family protein [Myxococcota bacterium]|nr:NAD-dependent epimerase/dehydratase family protein [Myxococcota bacterium]
MSPRAPKKRTLMITGVCGGVGRVLLRRVLDETDLHVVGIDKRNWVLDRPDRFEFRRADLRRGSVEDVFRTVRPWGLVHLAFVSDQRVSRNKRHVVNVQGTGRILDWCQRYGVQKTIMLSRASVYGASPDNPSLITEDMPLRLGAKYSELADLVEFDHLCRSWMWEHREVEMALLRPVNIVGPNIREGMLYQYLQRDPVLTALGFDPMIQIVHELDVIRAILLALNCKARGIFNITGDGTLPLSALLRAIGRRRLPVPHPLLSAGDHLAFALGLSKLPPHAIDFARFSCVVDGSKARTELGYEPSLSLEETVTAIPSRNAILE